MPSKTFYNLNQIKKYFNKETNTYEFTEDGELLDIELTFDMGGDKHAKYCANIKAGKIKAANINARDIETDEITACDIAARHINCNGKIDAFSINVRSVICSDIYATKEINVFQGVRLSQQKERSNI